jgi:hypothetical protein
MEWLKDALTIISGDAIGEFHSLRWLCSRRQGSLDWQAPIISTGLLTPLSAHFESPLNRQSRSSE